MTQPANKLLTAVVGDTGDTRTLRVDGVADLDDVTAVRGYVWREGVTAVELTGAVADATARTITVQLGSWLASTATPGIWSFECELDSPGSSITWPSTPATLPVRAQGG